MMKQYNHEGEIFLINYTGGHGIRITHPELSHRWVNIEINGNSFKAVSGGQGVIPASIRCFTFDEALEAGCELLMRRLSKNRGGDVVARDNESRFATIRDFMSELPDAR